MSEEKKPEDLLLEKLDAIEKRLTALETPVEKVDNEEKPDPKLQYAESILRHVLSQDFPKEKLDSWGLEQLSMAYDIKASFAKTDSTPLPPPPQNKEAPKKEDDPFKYARHAGRNEKGQFNGGIYN